MAKFFRNLTLMQEYHLWIHDFAPTNFDQIIGNEELVHTLKIYLNSGNLPNLLLSGPNGTGKSSIVKIFLKCYLQENFNQACLTIDGSINRGKDIVTNNGDSSESGTDDVLSYIKNRITLPTGIKRIVLIQSFDHMTKEAQNALRSMMETYSKNTRFIFICNDLDDVIEPIHSRCTSLRSMKFSDQEITDILTNILTKKGILNFPNEIIQVIRLISDGDVKQAINYLQIIANAKVISLDTFYKIFNLPSLHLIKQIIIKSRKPDDLSRQEAFNLLSDLLINGYNPSDVLNLFIQILVRLTDQEMDVNTRIQYLQRIALCIYNYELVPSVSFLYLTVINMELDFY